MEIAFGTKSVTTPGIPPLLIFSYISKIPKLIKTYFRLYPPESPGHLSLGNSKRSSKSSWSKEQETSCTKRKNEKFHLLLFDCISSIAEDSKDAFDSQIQVREWDIQYKRTHVGYFWSRVSRKPMINLAFPQKTVDPWIEEPSKGSQ